MYHLRVIFETKVYYFVNDKIFSLEEYNLSDNEIDDMKFAELATTYDMLRREEADLRNAIEQLITEDGLTMKDWGLDDG